MYSVILLTMLATPDYTAKTVVRERHTVTHSASGCEGAQARSGGCTSATTSSGCQGVESRGYGLVFRRSEPLYNGPIVRRLRDGEPIVQRHAAYSTSTYTTTRVRTQSTCPTCPNYVPPPQRVPPTSSKTTKASPDWAASIAGRYLAGNAVSDSEVKSVMGWVLTNAPNRSHHD